MIFWKTDKKLNERIKQLETEYANYKNKGMALAESNFKELAKYKKHIETLEKDFNKGVLYNPVKHSMGMTDFGSIKRRWKAWRLGSVAMLINMELRSGKHVTMVVSGKQPTFDFQGGLYMIHESAKYYNASVGMYCLDYHQDIDLPLKKEVPVDEIKKMVEMVNGADMILGIDPYVIKQYQKSEYVKNILSGHEMSSFFRKLLFIGLISAGSGVLLVLLFLNEFKYLDGIF